MNATATNLLVDIGNSKLKWAMSNGLDIHPGEAVLNAKVSNMALTQLWQGIVRPDQIAVACVGGRLLADTALEAANKLWPGIKVNLAKSQAESYGVKNAYKRPELLGVDRWLGMIAAYHRHQTDFCLVGCGTAVTVDVVNASGQHLGGLICPGLRLMKTALAQNTQLLSLSEETEFPKGLADHTGAAIHNGALMAICGLVEQILNQYAGDITLILTGGDAELIAPCLTKPAIIDPNLVLGGLALYLMTP